MRNSRMGVYSPIKEWNMGVLAKIAFIIMFKKTELFR